MTAVWPFIPQMDVVESLEWLTDVFKARKAEYRAALRPMPRIGYQFRYLLDDFDYGAARELARTVGGDPVFVPDWTVATQVPTIGAATVSLPVDVTRAPAYRVGGSALVFSGNSSYEVVTISALGTGTITVSATASGYAAPWVVPLRVGTFTQEFSGDRGPHAYTEGSAVFECIDTEDLSGVGGGIGYPPYLGDQVITEPTEIINGVKETNIREVEPVDSKTGPIYKYPIYASPNQASVLAWECLDATAVWNRRLWLHSRRGRWKQFWVSSWNADVVITRDISGGDASIEIAAIGFASKYPTPTDLAIVATDGGMWLVRVTGATSGSTGHELLTLSASFTGSADLAVISKTCKLTLSRLGSDRIDIQHLPGRQATVVAATKEIPVYP